jgi:hypothetical protein
MYVNAPDLTTLPHIGNACPVAPDTFVMVDLGDGPRYADYARHFAWGPGAGPDGEGRIYRYAVLARATRQPNPKHFA